MGTSVTVLEPEVDVCAEDSGILSASLIVWASLLARADGGVAGGG